MRTRQAQAVVNGAGHRSLALDALRGLAVAAMVLVNNPGSWSHVYPPLAHAAWHGCTPADLVFPMFLFAVGAAIALAPAAPASRVLRRGATLFALGLLLNGFPDYQLSDLRIMGVLQRIALCYLLAVPLVRRLGAAPLVAVLAALLAGHAALLQLVPAPGAPSPLLTAEGSLPAWVNRTLLGAAHLWRGGPFDPEGLLGTLGALATTLAGSLAGRLLAALSPRRAALALALCGGLALGAARVWSVVLPFNKSLWTSSYALHAAGAASVMLAILTLAAGSTRARRSLAPLEVFGRNALLLFVGSGLLARIIGLVSIDAGGKRRNVKAAFHDLVLAPIAGPRCGSLLYALLFLGAFWLALVPLHRRRWYWTV